MYVPWAFGNKSDRSYSSYKTLNGLYSWASFSYRRANKDKAKVEM